MGEGLVGIHSMVGGLVVVAFIIVVILAAIQASGGNSQWTRMASFVAAGLLAVQYILGVLLLGGGATNTVTHYLIGLLVIVPVALQHTAVKRISEQSRGMITVIWALAAAFLTVIAYLSGLWRI
jgi:hypothetical protein